MLGDQAVLEAELRADVVVHAPAGRERVVGEPVRAAALRVRLVLGEPHLEVLRAAGEHAPHRARLLARRSVNTGSENRAPGA